MQGICIQWFIDKYGFGNITARALYSDILRLSFGYRKKYAYIKQETFCIKSGKTLKKYRDFLTKEGIISWKITKGYTMYQILEPAEYIKNFELKGKNDISMDAQKNGPMLVDIWEKE